MKYEVISPDGLPIAPEPFRTRAAAEKAASDWAKRFEPQGYYAAADGRRIPVAQLLVACEIKEQGRDTDAPLS